MNDKQQLEKDQYDYERGRAILKTDILHTAEIEDFVGTL